MKKIISFFFFLLINHSIHSQFGLSELSSALNKKVRGTIVLKNGKKLHGKFRMPTIGAKKIYFFNSKKEKQKIDSNTIKYLISKGKKGGSSTLVYTKTANYVIRKKKGTTLRVSKKKAWLLITSSGKRAITYAAGTGFRVRKGVIQAVARGTMENSPSINIYGQKRRRDKVPILLDVEMRGNISRNVLFKRYGAYFFRGTRFQSKIKNKVKGYRAKNFIKIFNEYNGKK